MTAKDAAAKPLEITDPHDLPMESETTRIRKLTGFWRWALIVAAVVSLLLCMNQQLTWRFFVGYTFLNTEYFYLLIAALLPFTFLIFPGGPKAPLDRVPWYDALLFVMTLAASVYLMTKIRKSAELGWEMGGAPQDLIWIGYVMWAVHGKDIEGLFVVNKDKIARFRPVETGKTGESEIEITANLKQGEEVVSGSFQTLRTIKDGDRVKVDNTKPLAQPE